MLMRTSAAAVEKEHQAKAGHAGERTEHGRVRDERADIVLTKNPPTGSAPLPSCGSNGLSDCGQRGLSPAAPVTIATDEVMTGPL